MHVRNFLTCFAAVQDQVISALGQHGKLGTLGECAECAPASNSSVSVKPGLHIAVTAAVTAAVTTAAQSIAGTAGEHFHLKKNLIYKRYGNQINFYI